jgi:hypothetical protein
MSGVPLFVTLTAYAAAVGASLRWRGLRYMPPVLIAAGAVAIYLYVLKMDMETYRKAVEPLTFLLGPSVVALALPIYEQSALLKRKVGLFAVTAMFTTLFGCLLGLIWGFFALHDQTMAVVLSARMSTSAVAAATAHTLLGDPGGQEAGAVAGSLAILTGIIGPILGPTLLTRFGVRDPIERGAIMGTVAGGLGTVKALEEGPEAGAASAVGMCLAAIATALLLPALYFLVKSRWQ